MLKYLEPLSGQGNRPDIPVLTMAQGVAREPEINRIAD
jgi:hypothetical protein